jgi:hypothetical protein
MCKKMDITDTTKGTEVGISWRMTKQLDKKSVMVQYGGWQSVDEVDSSGESFTPKTRRCRRL